MLLWLFLLSFFIQCLSASNRPSSDYSMYPSRSASRKSEGPDIDMTSIIKYASLGASFYLGNRLAHFLDSKFISKFPDPIEAFNVTVIADLQREQEELWRIVYSISEGQGEQMSAISQATELKIRELESVLKDFMEKITMKLSDVERAVDQVSEVDTKLTTLQSAMSQIVSDVAKYERALSAVKESIPRILSSHDSKVIERLRSFSQEVKSILQGRSK